MWRELRDWDEELACRAGFDGLPSTGRAAAWVAGAIAVCAVGALWWSGALGAGASPGTAGAAPRVGTASSAEASRGLPATAATVTVHVVGQVRRAGVYELAGGSRVVDAVTAAGGTLGAADQTAVNLARVVADGEQIAIRDKGRAVRLQRQHPARPPSPGRST